MERIQDTIRAVIQDLDAHQKARPRVDVAEEVRSLLSSGERAHTKITHVRDGTVFILVDSSAWLYALSMRKERLLHTVHERAPQITNIVFRIGEMNG